LTNNPEVAKQNPQKQLWLVVVEEKQNIVAGYLYPKQNNLHGSFTPLMISSFAT
jgi:hypothetical protein